MRLLAGVKSILKFGLNCPAFTVNSDSGTPFSKFFLSLIDAVLRCARGINLNLISAFFPPHIRTSHMGRTSKTFSLPSDLEETMMTHRERRLTTRIWMTCLLCLLLLTLAPVSSGQKPTAADVPAIVKDLKDKEAKVRAEAVRRLTALGEAAKPAVPALVKLLKDKDEYTHGRAMHALGRIGPAARAALPALTKLFTQQGEY